MRTSEAIKALKIGDKVHWAEGPLRGTIIQIKKNIVKIKTPSGEIESVNARHAIPIKLREMKLIEIFKQAIREANK